MIKKFPVYYTHEQQMEAQAHIKKLFGIKDSEEGAIFHEVTSEYVHSDVAAHKTDDGETVYASFGMGAKEMNCPRKGYERAELVMHASPETELNSEKSGKLASAVVNMTKYPFRNNTWFGTGHTVDANPSYKEEFGFDAFALLEMADAADISDVGIVRFLTMIPIYQDERDWIMENSTFDYIEMLFEEFGESALYADKEREHFVPDQEQTDMAYMRNVMNILGLDEEGFYELHSFVEQTEEMGIEVTHEMIADWLSEHNNKEG